MALYGCTPESILFSVVIVAILLPSQYLVPDFHKEEEVVVEHRDPDNWFDFNLQEVPAIDIFYAGLIVVMVLLINLSEWVQIKLMERKIYKQNQYLTQSIERLRAMDAQQEELEATLKIVHDATSEYNLLLYLLLKEQKILTRNGPPSNCFFDKTLDVDDIDNFMFS